MDGVCSGHPYIIQTLVIATEWAQIRDIPVAENGGSFFQIHGCIGWQAIDTDKPIYGIDIKTLQNTLESENVMIHFDDSLIPDTSKEGVGEKVDIGHI